MSSEALICTNAKMMLALYLHSDVYYASDQLRQKGQSLLCNLFENFSWYDNLALVSLGVLLF